MASNQDLDLSINFKCHTCGAYLGTMEDIADGGVHEHHICLRYYGSIHLDFDKGIAFGADETNKTLSDTGKDDVGDASTDLETEVVPRSGYSESWTDQEVQLLINLYSEHHAKFFSPMHNKKTVWKLISEDMKNQNFFRDGSKCDEKFRNLKKTYEKLLKEQNSTGNSRCNWRFFNAMHDLFFHSPRYNPVATVSSTGVINLKRTRTEVSEGSLSNGSSRQKVCKTTSALSEETHTDLCSNKPQFRQGKRTSQNKESVLLKLDERKERRHQERMQQRNQIFQWFKNKFGDEDRDK